MPTVVKREVSCQERGTGGLYDVTASVQQCLIYILATPIFLAPSHVSGIMLEILCTTLSASILSAKYMHITMADKANV